MTSVSIVENPNKFAASYRVDADLLAPLFSKIAIAKTGSLTQYSPLAQHIYTRGGGVLRIDFAFEKGNTLISLARKVLAWDQPNIEKGRSILAEFFGKGQPAILLDALSTNVEALKPFNADAHPISKIVSQTFHEEVNPILARDGGAMELLNVELRATGEIFADVALLGSCNGCGSAETATLKRATKQIEEVLDLIKKNNRGNAFVQTMKFHEIRTNQQPELVISRA